MNNKFALSLFLALAILLTACGPQATAAPAPTEAPYTRSGGSAATAPVASATDTTSADNSGYGNYGNPPPVQPTAPQPTATTASNPSPSGGGATLSVGSGSYLVGANSMTLYLLTSDPAGASKCAGGCANNWPPLTVTGQPSAGTGVNASLLATSMRADGSTQVTYNGHPLYYFKGDSAPGDQNGQGTGGVWFVVSASGDAIKQ